MSDRDEALRPALPGDESRLVSVASYADPLRAQLARSLLLSAGIECFLQGEHVNQMLASAFRARLRVMAADADEAREILREVEQGEMCEVRDA